MVSKMWSTERNRKYVGNGTWYDRVDDTLELTAGERGCAASHIRFWKKAARGTEPIVVVEDDAVPSKDFAQKLKLAMKEVPADADLLYLGYSKPDKAPWRKEVGESIVQADYVWTTVGYVVWPKGARKLLARLPIDSPVDNFMSWATHTNHTVAYAVKNSIINQEAPWNLASDVSHSDEISQHRNEREQFLQQVTLFTRPFKEAQKQFSEVIDKAVTGIDDNSTLANSTTADDTTKLHKAFLAASKSSRA
jgi:glycosyl transferase family 25